ncbi:sodium- and chloride-dependent neutral and basic amino acid transporter B(0+)-like [Macrobrachium nipponense]|uniref:sodium- and chloride-dependent neutral and basic amino acid transporter B(0+)-like n=1 Tax=Macrobrachium nipponense TaxID=159736 RepID=UPI0030C847BD
MLFFLGIGSVFVQIEAMTASSWTSSRSGGIASALTFVACLVMFLLALLCCTRGGMYVTLILDTYSATVPIIFACLCEVIVFSYIYGSGKVARDVEMMTNKPLNLFWYFMWLVLTPFCLLELIFLEVVVVVRPPEYRDSVSPSWIQAAGWMSAIASISTIPAYALWYLVSAEGSFAKRMASAFTASPAWGPALESHRRAWANTPRLTLCHPLLHPRLMRRNLWRGCAPPQSSSSSAGVYPPKDGGRSLELGAPLTNGAEGH